MINIFSIIKTYQIGWGSLINLTPLMLLGGILIAINYHFIQANYWLAGLLFLFIFAKISKCKIAIILLLSLLMIAGFRTQYYLQYHHVVTLSQSYHFVPITGEIASVEAISLGKYRVIIDKVTSDKFIPQDNKVRLRLNIRADFAPHKGDLIKLRVNIFPPSRPAIQGGADFARYFYAKNIGGIGYSLGKATIIKQAAQALDSWQIINATISNWRLKIDDALVRNISPPQAGIAIALITGGRAAIPSNINKEMQISGITHILSISGLHMSMVCGLLYFGLRLLLASIPPLALRLPIKQYCAGIALLSGAIYLAIADFPVPAIRAYVMIALIFAGIICNREADALRSLVLAACGLLLFNPLTALDVGFQLSFVATYALIIAYRRIAKLNSFMRANEWGLLPRILIYVGNIIISSLVAGTATAPLVLFHFGLFSSYSVLTNVIVLPILSFVVMPSLIFGLALESFITNNFALQIADYGLKGVIYCSHFVANLTQSSLHMPTMSIFTLLVMMLAIIVLLHNRNIRAGALAVIALLISCFIPNNSLSPDILVAEDASAIAVKVAPAQWLLLRGSSGNFFVKQWRQATSGEYISYANAKKAGNIYGFMCDAQGCDGAVAGRNIRTRYDYRSNAPLCLSQTDISIASFYAKKSYMEGGICAIAKVQIERDMLQQKGSILVTFADNGKAQLWNACKQSNPAPWLRCTKSYHSSSFHDR